MTREEAIKMLKSKMDGTVDTSYEWAETVRMAIEALHKTEAQIEADEWCTDCKEYDHERHCCPRWNRVIRETLKDMQMEKRTEERTKTHACDLRRYAFGNYEFNLETAYHDCKLIFDGITDDDSFQEADTGLILYYANEIIYALHEALQGDDTNVLSNDCISRQAAISVIAKWMLEYGGEGEERERNALKKAAEEIKELPSAQPKIEERKEESAQNVLKDDSVSRKAAIDAVNGVIADYIPTLYGRYEALPLEMAMAIKRLPTAEPTLYGYNIKHLAFVARVMEEEGVTAEYAARTFDDISRILKMVIDEAREKILAEVVKKGGLNND